MRTTNHVIVLEPNALAQVAGAAAASQPPQQPATQSARWRSQFATGWKPCEISPAFPAYESWLRDHPPTVMPK